MRGIVTLISILSGLGFVNTSPILSSRDLAEALAGANSLNNAVAYLTCAISSQSFSAAAALGIFKNLQGCEALGFNSVNTLTITAGNLRVSTEFVPKPTTIPTEPNTRFAPIPAVIVIDRPTTIINAVPTTIIAKADIVPAVTVINPVTIIASPTATPVTPAEPQSCVPGTYSTSGFAPCIACSSGSFTSSSSSTSCTQCLAGYSSLISATGCTPCPAGSYSALGDKVCTPCSAGSYSSHFAATECNLCQLGFFSDSDGSISCDTCQPKTFTASKGAIGCTNCNLSSGSNTCDPQTGGDTTCITGFGLSSPGKTYSSCTACPIGSYSPQGGTICNICIAGTTSIAGSGNCIPCPAGFTSIAGDVCTSCLINTFSSSGAGSCTTCNGGTSSIAGSAVCNACLAGQFSLSGSNCSNCPASSDSVIGASSCSPCQAGTFSIGDGAVCSSCLSGSYNPSASLNNTQCLTCPAGTSSNLIGATSCTPCLSGTYSDGSFTAPTSGSSCTVCPSLFSSSNPGSGITCDPKSGIDTTCLIGTGLQPSSATPNKCTACFIGTVSPGIVTTCSPCSAGTTSAGNSNVCFNCPAGTRGVTGGLCIDCLRNTFSSSGDTSCTTCPAGTSATSVSSATCMNCSGGKASIAGGDCTACSINTFSNSGDASCTTCPVHTGSVAGSGSCITCPDLQTSTPGSGCAFCPPGSDLFGFECNPCFPGYFAIGNDGNKCLACPINTYNTLRNQTSCLDCPSGLTSLPGSSECLPSYNLLILDQNSQALGYLSAPSNYQGTFQVGPRDGSITFFSPKNFSPGSFVELFMQNSPGRSALGIPNSSEVFASYSATLTGVSPRDPIFVDALQLTDKGTYGRSLIWKMGAASNGQYSVSVQTLMGYSNGGTIGAQSTANFPVVTFVLDPLPTS